VAGRLSLRSKLPPPVPERRRRQLPGRDGQNNSLNPNSITLGHCESVVIWPKAPLVGEAFGLLY
jgi:hypothetical protein